MCPSCNSPKKASTWFCFCGVLWHKCQQHRDLGFSLPRKPENDAKLRTGTTKAITPLGIIPNPRFFKTSRHATVAASARRRLRAVCSTAVHGNEVTNVPRAALVTPGFPNGGVVRRPTVDCETLHQRLLKRLRINPSHCPNSQKGMKRDAMSMDIHTNMANHPTPQPQPSSTLVVCPREPKGQARGKRAKRGRSPPAPPPSQRLLAYMDSGLIRGSKANALKRNAKNPPEDHSNSSSTKRPCTQQLECKAAEQLAKQASSGNKVLDDIIKALGTTNPNHPAFIKSAIGTFPNPKDSNTQFSSIASNQPALGTGVSPCAGHQGQGQSPT